MLSTAELRKAVVYSKFDHYRQLLARLFKRKTSKEKTVNENISVKYTES
jgi:hypothetical protein